MTFSIRSSGRLRSFERAFLALSLFVPGCADEHQTDDHGGGGTGAAAMGASTAGDASVDPCDQPLSHDSMLLDLGGGFQVVALRQSPDRILARSFSAWALWDRQRGAVIARGRYDHPGGEIDLAGDTILVPSTAGYELRSARDGALQASIPRRRDGESGAFSADGSYAFTLGQGQIRVWDRAGKLLRVHQREPRFDEVYAGANELRYPPVWRDSVIETLSIDSGVVRESSSFDGQFIAWFRDGTHFITREADVNRQASWVRVYTKDGTLVQAHPVASLVATFSAGGEGDLFWFHPADDDWNTHVYRLGASEPLQSFGPAGASTSWRAPVAVFKQSETTIESLDLRGGAPKLVRYTVPGYKGPADVDGDGRLAYAKGFVIHDAAELRQNGKSRALGCSELTHLVGWRDRLAISSADRVTRLYSYRTGKPQLIWKMSDFHVQELAFMDDGRVVAVHGWEGTDDTQLALRTIEFDEHDQLRRAVLRPRSGHESYLSTAPHGNRYVLTNCEAMPGLECTWRLMGFDGEEMGKPQKYRSTWGLPLLSPSGTQVAVYVWKDQDSGGGTDIILEKAGVKAHLANKRPVLWLDDHRLLVEDEAQEQPSEIVDPAGNTIATLAVPTVGDVELASDGFFHDQDRVYRQRDGKVVWSLPASRSSEAERWSVLAPPVLSPAMVAGRFVFLREAALYVEPITLTDASK